ncbi:MAG: hypothetical protein J0M01_05290 [Dechloromonas sp.]|nr:hypothetical protein [Dechloromonas sp.]MBN8462216.1 hypothetical protein [Dechloromonas sp.]
MLIHSWSVIPAQAGIRQINVLNTGLRRCDEQITVSLAEYYPNAGGAAARDIVFAAAAAFPDPAQTRVGPASLSFPPCHLPLGHGVPMNR